MVIFQEKVTTLSQAATIVEWLGKQKAGQITDRPFCLCPERDLNPHLRYVETSTSS